MVFKPVYLGTIHRHGAVRRFLATSWPLYQHRVLRATIRRPTRSIPAALDPRSHVVGRDACMDRNHAFGRRKTVESDPRSDYDREHAVGGARFISVRVSVRIQGRGRSRATGVFPLGFSRQAIRSVDRLLTGNRICFTHFADPLALPRFWFARAPTLDMFICIVIFICSL